MKTEAFEVLGADRPGPWLITCDHASNRVPDWVNGGHLGLSEADMGRHIAYDLGAAGVTKRLAEVLNCPAVLSRFSRLVIDPNRGEDDPTLIMHLYDGTIIEGNRRIDDADRLERLERLYRPYHDAIDELMEGRQQIYVAVHSFTPRLNGRNPRPWHVTVLASPVDTRFSDRLLAELREEPGVLTAENEPYSGALAGDSVDRHALRTGVPNALIEFRHDEIETPEQQIAWAERLAPLLVRAAEGIL
ncbi:MAG: N-formylglutamate amidohydrolase [Pseudomonadota bacterium]